MAPVTVTQILNVYSVTFGGSLFGFNQSQMTATGAGLTNVAVGTLVSGAGGTVVANGASVELQGGVTVAGEPLILQGQRAPRLPMCRWAGSPRGRGRSTTRPDRRQSGGLRTGHWCGGGPDGCERHLPGTTAGGGAWKTTDRGKTWLPMFDLQNGSAEEVQVVTLGRLPATGIVYADLHRHGRQQAPRPVPLSATATALQGASGVERALDHRRRGGVLRSM